MSLPWWCCAGAPGEICPGLQYCRTVEGEEHYVRTTEQDTPNSGSIFESDIDDV